MKYLFYAVIVLAMVVLNMAAPTDDGDVDEAHDCQMARQCKTCFAVEFCTKIAPSWIQRWWFPCPSTLPYCNPYTQRCEATITPICQSLLPNTVSPTK